MNLNEWNAVYDRISRDLGFSKELDFKSSRILSSILGSSSGLAITEKFRGKNAYVVGNAPDLKNYLEKRTGEVSIVADSAIDTYLELVGMPDIIVTDLDGDIPAMLKCNESGTLCLIHAHGDNIGLIEEWSRKFTGPRIGTTQNQPLDNIFNFFGFTDGDRAAFFANYLNSREIRLVGFDFKNPSYKSGGNRERKLKKLTWAKFLLDLLSKERGTELIEGGVILL
ncbi:MAG: DUF115 domain-containing protein [Thermoplasmatales archaeon]|nr:DUF115 domain-containing protein [Thermoplasmatales archaeon]MCW6169986.1 DUF115 domain-containing protein [Thermoplasmatales archaeon]